MRNGLLDLTHCSGMQSGASVEWIRRCVCVVCVCVCVGLICGYVHLQSENEEQTLPERIIIAPPSARCNRCNRLHFTDVISGDELIH